MSILIKNEGLSKTVGQEMPSSCLLDCKLVQYCLHVPRWADEEVLDRLKIERAKNCPLIEVKEQEHES